MLEVGGLYEGVESKRLREQMMVVMPAVALLVAIVCTYLVIFKENYSAWAAAFMFFSIIASACYCISEPTSSPSCTGHRRDTCCPN